MDELDDEAISNFCFSNFRRKDELLLLLLFLLLLFFVVVVCLVVPLTWDDHLTFCFSSLKPLLFSSSF